MEYIINAFDFLMSVDTHLEFLIANYGVWIYLILFLIIFCETGLVVAPFLPGDSLLFPVGALAALGSINLWFVVPLLIGAAFLGNQVNYMIGSYVGPKIFKQGNRFIKKEHLTSAQEFYKKHGSKAIIIGRYLPLFRTFVPFVAGISLMDKAKYTFYNIISAIAWVVSLVLMGYLFGQINKKKNNFSIVILAIIIISYLPFLYAIINKFIAARRAKTSAVQK